MFPLLSKILLPPLLGLTIKSIVLLNLEGLNDLAPIQEIPLEEELIEYKYIHVFENKIQPPINETEISRNYQTK